MWKAQHKLDGNIYAIKKIRLNKNSTEENRKIKREVTYLSGLNSPFIVRYFQTWVEIERDPERIKELMHSDEYDDEEYDEEEEDLGGDSFFYSEMKRSARIARNSANRTNSVERQSFGAQKSKLALMRML